MQIKPMVKTINQQIYNFNGIIYYLRKIQTGWIYCFFLESIGCFVRSNSGQWARADQI